MPRSAFLFVRLHGEALRAAAPASQISRLASAVSGERLDLLRHLVLGMLTVLLVSRLVSWAFARLRQPPVMGDDVRSKRMARSLGVTGPQRLVIRGERKGTVEAAVRRALTRAGGTTVQRTLEMFELLTAELVRED